MALAAAPHISGFRALSPLGYGPTSTIFSAESTSLGRWVALTVYSTTLSDDRAQRSFLRAFEMARRLGSHPHAATLLDAGLTPERQPYVASEIYERGTLESRLAGRRPLDVDEVLAVGIALAGALETAHRAGVIHGGLHPGRVLIGNDRVPAIADLNLVPLVEGGLAALVGPRHHVPPEVLEGEDLSPATDVFSLASMLYMTLTGGPPYRGDDPEADTAASLLLRMLQRAVPPIGRGDVPPSLEARLAQALDSQAINRPATPLAFATQLQLIQQELGLPVTDPVVLDIVPALTVADDPAPDPTIPARPEPAPAEAPHADTTPAPSTNGTASGNGSTPMPRVFVPYQPPETEPRTDAPTPSTAPPLASVSNFPAPPEPEPAPQFTGYEAPAPEAAAADAPGPYGSSFDQWPWVDEASGDTDTPPPSPAPVLNSPAYPRPPAAEPPVDVAPAAEPGRDPEAPAALPEPDQPGTTEQHARALPVMVLMSLVAVLVVGVGWMIITGENPSQASSDTTQSSAALDEDGAVPPDSVTAVENATGVQIDWDGSSDEPQVVVVLSASEAPRALPAETGSALQIDAAELTPSAGYCFAVAPAPSATSDAAAGGALDAVAIAGDLADDAIGSNACIHGATPDSVQRP